MHLPALNFHFVDLLFIAVGIAIGVILSLQIQAKPAVVGSFPLNQIEAQKNLLNNFSLEQKQLKEKLAALEEKTTQAEQVIAQRSSKKTLQKLQDLRFRTGFTELKGDGIRIVLRDNPLASRLDFSTVGENFVQASDLRDLINGLFLKNAEGISINGTRVTALTSIQSVFDSVLVDNMQISPPFKVEAIGVSQGLREAARIFEKRKIQLHVEESVPLIIPAAKNQPTFHLISTLKRKKP